MCCNLSFRRLLWFHLRHAQSRAALNRYEMHSLLQTRLIVIYRVWEIKQRMDGPTRPHCGGFILCSDQFSMSEKLVRAGMCTPIRSKHVLDTCSLRFRDTHYPDVYLS